MQSYTLDQLQIVQYLKPDSDILGLRGLEIVNRETDQSQVEKVNQDYAGAASKLYAYMPLVRINYGFELTRPFLKSFSINCNGFLPVLNMTVTDGSGQLRGKYYPRCGSIVNVYIASLGPENYYKPIRADFLITSCRQSNDIYLDPLYYSQTPCDFNITAVLNIPRVFYRHNIFESGTSFHSLMNLCAEIGLGFASNMQDGDTVDSQIWLNNHGSLEEYIKHISEHSWKDSESFQTCFIDLWYNLNFVEVSRLFSQLKENSTCRIYTTSNPEEEISPREESEMEKEMYEKNGTGLETEKIYDYQLINSKHMQGWSHFFSSYTPVTSLFSMLYDGFKNNISWYDFLSKEKKESVVVPFSPETEGMLPVNRGKLDYKGEAPEMLSEMQSYSFAGTLAEQHQNYYLAEVQNKMNMSDIDKFGIDVELQCVNPALVRYSRIRVILLARNDQEKDIITEEVGDGVSVEYNGADVNLDDHPGMKSDSPADLPEELKEMYNIMSDFDDSSIYDETNTEKINQALSGYYVITGYQIFLDDDMPMLRTNVSLRRKEMYPPLRTDYE